MVFLSEIFLIIERTSKNPRPLGYFLKTAENINSKPFLAEILFGESPIFASMNTKFSSRFATEILSVARTLL